MTDLTDQLFLDRICQNPGDNLAVGVYGDWLEEQGDSKAAQVHDFYHGIPLGRDFKTLIDRLTDEQMINFALLVSNDVLPLIEEELPNDKDPQLALEASRDEPDAAWTLGNRVWALGCIVADTKLSDALAAIAWTAWAASYNQANTGELTPELTSRNKASSTANAVYAALRVKPKRLTSYLLSISSFILFGCNVVVLD